MIIIIKTLNFYKTGKTWYKKKLKNFSIIKLLKTKIKIKKHIHNKHGLQTYNKSNICQIKLQLDYKQSDKIIFIIDVK